VIAAKELLKTFSTRGKLPSHSPGEELPQTSVKDSPSENIPHLKFFQFNGLQNLYPEFE
jgi:hypothetical protein